MSSLFNWNQLDRQAKLGLISILVIAVSLPLAIVLNFRQTQLDSAAKYSTQPIKIGIDGKPIKVSKGGETLPDRCVVSGCSSELCVNRATAPVNSTCQWKAEYACYRSAKCELQDNGQCGWTMDNQLRQCLEGTSGIGGESQSVNTGTASNNQANSEPPTQPQTQTQTQTKQQMQPSEFICDRNCPDGTRLTGSCQCEPLDTNAVCGNNICETGEADTSRCPRCEPGQRCPLAPCIITQGTCPRDCNNQSTPPPTPKPTTDTPSTSCNYQGNTYRPGQSFPAADGCNRCTCTPNGVICTERACPDSLPSQLPNPTTNPIGDACLDSGGQYQQFRDSCADQCNAGPNCLQVLTTACDCGPDSCFNGIECVRTHTTNPPVGGSPDKPATQPNTTTTTIPAQPPTQTQKQTQSQSGTRTTPTSTKTGPTATNQKQLAITTNNLSSGVVDRPYQTLIIATSQGSTNQKLDLNLTNLPEGLATQKDCQAMSSFNRDRNIYRCTIEGTPKKAGSHSLTATVSDGQGNSTSKQLSLTVRNRQNSLFDIFKNFWSGLFK